MVSKRLFQSVAEQIAELIDEGAYPPGTRLPGERELAEKLGVSRVTIREAEIALQAVGVVLVSAMLITPAAAAYLLTDRMHRMLLLAVGFGVASGVLGAFISFLKPNIPTGPCMVLGASAVFAMALFGGPRHGVMTRWWRHMSRSKRVQRENTLKAVYQVLENRSAQPEDSVSLKELAERRRETLDEVSGQASALKQHGLVTLHEGGIDE